MNSDKLRAWVEIRTDAFVHNLKVAKELTGKKVMCVIKGDAHGHGAIECGRVLEENGADAFAVACLTEGIALRESGISAPILLLGWTPAECADKLAQYELTQSLIDEDYALELNAAAEERNVSLNVHIKLDTGMSRTGIFAQDNAKGAAQMACRIASLPHLNVKGIFTHFAAADMPEKDDFTAWQLKNYEDVLREMKNQGFTQPVIRHTGNSAGIMYHKEVHFDMVRMGVMMYAAT